ncbi:MAG: hypothetical protein HC849_09570 [Oscillatoriales cyanobacterium RU_3_3]|nr:hypothetical protein [Oscillatoriales cyanobacterium RU_3_3]
MNKQPRIPDPETSKRLLSNLRRTRMEVQEVNLELGEINAMLAEQLRQQRLNRVRRSLHSSTTEL